MIKEALQYIVGISETQQLEIDGRKYSDKPLHAVKEPLPSAVTINTLTGVADYLLQNPDNLDLNKIVVHVESPSSVKVFSRLRFTWQDRAPFLAANFAANPFPCDRYHDVEKFIIYLQTYFVPTEDTDKLIKLVSFIHHEGGVTVTDDGKSQTVATKTGIARMGHVDIPNPVRLRPYRTFLELEQPEASFLLRVKMDNGPQCALYDCDGGLWQLAAMANIKTWLSGQAPAITILA